MNEVILKGRHIAAALTAAFLPPLAAAQDNGATPETATGPVGSYRAKRSASGTNTDATMALTLADGMASPPLPPRATPEQ
jgi:hypothetical protein